MNQGNEEEMLARFAQNLWSLRKQRGLSQEALAMRAEIHHSQISMFEQAKRSAPLPTLLALAGGLEVSIEALFDGITYQPPEPGRSGRYLVKPVELPIGKIGKRADPRAVDQQPSDQIGRRLRQIRREAGITQEQLAEISGVTRATICLIETGKRRPQAATLLAIVRALDRSPADLLAGS